MNKDKYKDFNYVIGLLATVEGNEEFKYETMKKFFQGEISFIDLITETFALIENSLVNGVDSVIQHNSTKENGII